MFSLPKNNGEPNNTAASSMSVIPEEIEALRELWKNEIVNFLEALPEAKHLLEPHISQVLEKLDNIVDSDELSEYCFPGPEGASETPIATDIDMAISCANLEVFEEHPNGKSQLDAFRFLRRFYQPYRNNQFEKWRDTYLKR